VVKYEKKPPEKKKADIADWNDVVAVVLGGGVDGVAANHDVAMHGADMVS
jgi:heterodisulfide reductase subunit A-like polyferredoxin